MRQHRPTETESESLISPPAEISAATIMKGVSKNLETLNSFEKQLEAMGEAGLNLPLFRSWLSDDEEGMQWPHGSISGFFQERFLLAESAYKGRIPDLGYYELMGIKDEEHCRGFADELSGEKGEYWTPQHYLSKVFTSIALLARSQYPGIPQELPSRSQYDLDLKTMLACQAGQEIELHVMTNDIGGLGWYLMPRKFLRFAEIPEHPDMLYHSTSATDALSIIMSCPWVGAPSRYGRDFDGAFYLNTSPAAAVEWARKIEKKGIRTCVLLYNVPPAARSSWKQLNLDNHAQWSQLVTAFRSSQFTDLPLRHILQSFEVIKGPMVRNPRQVAAGEQSPVSSEFIQLAIISPSLAAGLNDYLCGIFLF